MTDAVADQASPWAALTTEHDYRVREISGRVPERLRGVLYRIGPGRLEVGGHRLGHIFDGDGMVSRFAIDDDGIGFRNRYVRTHHYTKASKEWIGRGVGTQGPGGMVANMFRIPANVSNTIVVAHAGGLFSLWEAGRPYRLDPETLETIGREDFDGALKLIGAFSAHPKVDARTGELFNFGIEMFPRPMIRCYRRDLTGALHRLGTFPLARPSFCHDFALTEHYLVFLVDPIVVGRPLRALLGLDSIDGCMEFKPELGTRIALVPRDGGKVRVIETDAFFHFHANNAYEEPDGEVVVEIVRHRPVGGWAGWNRSLRERDGLDGSAFGGQLERVRISVNGRVCSEPLLEGVGCEFPQIDHRFEAARHPATYVAAASVTAGAPDTIVALDHASGSIDGHRVDDGHSVCEPLFAADPDRAESGGGGLLSVEHLGAQARSRLVIVDSERLSEGPVATAELEHHLPMGFHGTYVPA